MFSASPDTTLPCPRCRHVSLVGNSVQALRKNYAVLALIHSSSAAAATSSAAASNFDCDYTDDDDEDADGDGDEDGDAESLSRRRCSRASAASSSGGGCGPVIEVGAHQDLRLVRRIGEGRRAGVEMWAALISGAAGRCRHPVAVKKVVVTEETSVDWVVGQLENLRRASMWCRNVCTFHGFTRMESSLCLVMDRCYGSVQSEMQRNEGRLTLEQILRFVFIFKFLYSALKGFECLKCMSSDLFVCILFWLR